MGQRNDTTHLGACTDSLAALISEMKAFFKLLAEHARDDKYALCTSVSRASYISSLCY